MHHFFSSIFGLFLSPFGILLLALLDSTMFFFLPAALDTAVIVMSARNRDLFWLYPILAVFGSALGAILTFAFGQKIGEPGLKRWVSEPKLRKVRRKIDKGGVVALGTAALLPPPFPLTPVVLTSGALGLDKKKFFPTLIAMRFLRFETEGLLARIYGRRILTWLNSSTFEYAVTLLMALAVAGTAVSVFQYIQKRK